MTPHGFSHLYELFATFNLAYIIIDEVTENPFVSLISEKVLKKYKPIHEIQKKINSIIIGHKTSLDTIENTNLSNEVISSSLPKQKIHLDKIQNSNKIFFDKCKEKIHDNYITKIFVFLNFFLLLYCISMLFIGGLYEESKGAININNLKLDNSVLVFSVGSLIILMIGWIYEDQKKNSSNENNQSSFIIENGFHIACISFAILAIVSICTYFFNWTYKINFSDERPHDIVIIFSVFFPISNFIAYFLKANKRANKILPELLTSAEDNRNSCFQEFKQIEDFIGTFNHLKRESVTIN